MSINIFVNFNGNCREAVEFYAEVFNTEKPKFMTFKNSPPDPNFTLPEEAKDLIMFTSLKINDSDIMFSDTFPGMPFTAGNNINITVVDTDIENVKSYFNKMKVGGTIEMDLQETFWSKCYGSVVDKFGVPWQFSHSDGRQY